MLKSSDRSELHNVHLRIRFSVTLIAISECIVIDS